MPKVEVCIYLRMALKNTDLRISTTTVRLACISLSLFLLGALEISARLLYREDRELYKILNLLEPDRELFWKLRPRLNVSFQGAVTVTNQLGLREKTINPVKKPGTLRILCLGASPTFGWGVAEEYRYSNVLEQLLRHSPLAGGNVEVINAGIIGYSSYQGAGLLKKLLPVLKPDIVTIPFVVNDVDKYRFFLNDGKSDKEAVAPGRVRLLIERGLARSTLVKVMRRAMFGWNTDSSELKVKAAIPFAETRRVSAQDYSQNLLAMVQACRQQGVKPVLVKMPVYNPFPEAIETSPQALQKAGQLWTAGLRQAAAGDPAGARVAIEKALQYAPYSAKMYNMLGRLSYRLGQNKEALSYFEEEKKMELRACIENVRQFGVVMGKLSAQAGVPMADAAAGFKTMPGKAAAALFFEPKRDVVHLSPLGHGIVSQELYRVILKPGFWSQH